MKFVAVNYNYDPSWVLDYTDDYLIYDRSEIPVSYNGVDPDRTIITENLGHVDYDKLTYLIDYYDELPEIFYWGKVNLWKSVSKEELEAALKMNRFEPLVGKHHKTYEDKFSRVCFYDDHGMYNERNDSWYVSQLDTRYFYSYHDFAKRFGLPDPEYLAFAPGGNYILTKERVWRYPPGFYEMLRDLLPYSSNPSEAHMLERTYYNLWK